MIKTPEQLSEELNITLNNIKKQFNKSCNKVTFQPLAVGAIIVVVYTLIAIGAALLTAFTKLHITATVLCVALFVSAPVILKCFKDEIQNSNKVLDMLKESTVQQIDAVYEEYSRVFDRAALYYIYLEDPVLSANILCPLQRVCKTDEELLETLYNYHYTVIQGIAMPYKALETILNNKEDK